MMQAAAGEPLGACKDAGCRHALYLPMLIRVIHGGAVK